MSNIIVETKNHILKINPDISDVKISVDKGPGGQFISKIHLRSKAGILHAVKKATSYKESIDRSYHAIIKQMEKLKEKKKSRRQSMIENFG